MEDNELCGLSGDHPVRGTYTTEGITKLCEGLKESNVASLECAPPHLASAPVDTSTLSPFPSCPLACSLWGNHIRAEGASMLAAIPKETQITKLG